MKPGFMSSVCPKQTLSELIETAKKYGYQGIEFRVEWDHQHGIELNATDEELQQAKQLLTDNGIVASCIATGVQFNSGNRSDHLSQRDSLQKYIGLAAKMDVPYLRTFSDPVPEEDEVARNEVLNLAAESYASVDDWAKQHGVQVLVETHTNMRAHWAKQILDTASADSLNILWDAGHHLGRGQSVEEAYPYLCGQVSHLHFRSNPSSETLTDVDNQQIFSLLAANRFTGFFSLEVINPEDSEAVLNHHIAKFTEFMKGI